MVGGDRLLAYEGQRDSVDRGKDGQGRQVWRFSQSLLKQVDVCPERGRRQMLRLDEDSATDSTALGRSVHGAIEACLRDVIDGMGPWTLDDMITVACDDFDDEMALPSSRWVKYKNAPTLHKQIVRCLSTWYDDVLPSLRPKAVEVNFGPFDIYEDSERVIELRGQIDYIDERFGLADWKTGGREWIEWEHKRWDVQPTVYIGAYELETYGEIQPAGHTPWTWHVLNVDGGYQRIETTRSPGDWAWLIDRCLVIAKTLEAELPEWPKNDTHALCNEKWCASWAQCKGLYMPVGWPKVTTQGPQKDNES